MLGSRLGKSNMNAPDGYRFYREALNGNLHLVDDADPVVTLCNLAIDKSARMRAAMNTRPCSLCELAVNATTGHQRAHAMTLKDGTPTREKRRLNDGNFRP